MIIGTMPYMSPEQVEGKVLDHRTDLFSLGVMFHEMLTGARPFTGESSPQLMSSILRDTPASASAHPDRRSGRRVTADSPLPREAPGRSRADGARHLQRAAARAEAARIGRRAGDPTARSSPDPPSMTRSGSRCCRSRRAAAIPTPRARRRAHRGHHRRTGAVPDPLRRGAAVCATASRARRSTCGRSPSG